MNNIFTVETIDELLAVEDDDEGELEEATRAVLKQLRECLVREQNPKVIQLEVIDECLIALKSDGTLWRSLGGSGINWKAMPLP